MKLIALAESSEPLTIAVQGTIEVSTAICGTADAFVHNVIVANLDIAAETSSVEGDGIQIHFAHHVWVDHCFLGDAAVASPHWSGMTSPTAPRISPRVASFDPRAMSRSVSFLARHRPQRHLPQRKFGKRRAHPFAPGLDAMRTLDWRQIQRQRGIDSERLQAATVARGSAR